MKPYSQLRGTLKEEVLSYNIFIPVFYREEWVDSGWRVDIDSDGTPRLKFFLGQSHLPAAQEDVFNEVLWSYRNAIEDKSSYEDFEDWERAKEELIEEIQRKLLNLVNNPKVEWGLPYNGRERVVREIARDFNESELEKYLDSDLEGIVTSLRIIGYTNDSYGIVCRAEVTRQLNKKEEAALVEYIRGQCSDGWGEGIEQENILGYFISTWNRDALRHSDRIHRLMKPTEGFKKI